MRAAGQVHTIDDGPDGEVTPRVLDIPAGVRRAGDFLLHW